MHMTLGEAWSAWFAGDINKASVLWGVELFWWGRIGKALQLVGGLTIVAEIIGADALRKFGSSLHNRITWPSFRENLHHIVVWMRLTWRSIGETDSKEQDRLMDEASKYGANLVSGILSIGGAIAFWFLVEVSSTWYLQLLASFFFLFVMLAVVAPVFILASFVIFYLVGLVLDVIVIEPVAWVLEREYLDKLIKVFAVIMLVVGFHFDFLAS